MDKTDEFKLNKALKNVIETYDILKELNEKIDDTKYIKQLLAIKRFADIVSRMAHILAEVLIDKKYGD